MCVHNQEGVENLKDVMRTAADAEKLEFVDASSETGASMRATGADKALKRDPARAINVGIKGAGGTFVLGGNLGLPPYQVALGFGTGSDPAKAHQLSDRLVRSLSESWDVKTVPQSEGVLPMKDCGPQAAGELTPATATRPAPSSRV